jgi:hypothetical protein
MDTSDVASGDASSVIVNKLGRGKVRSRAEEA